jgi:hypothetical protein
MKESTVKKPKYSKKKMLIEALERIEYIQELINSYGEIKSFLNNNRGNVNCGDIFITLVERELDEWRALLMWGLVIDQPTRDRIKAAAHNRFLSNKISVSHWMNNGIKPSAWLVEDEEQFRKMVAEAFKPET